MVDGGAVWDFEQSKTFQILRTLHLAFAGQWLLIRLYHIYVSPVLRCCLSVVSLIYASGLREVHGSELTRPQLAEYLIELSDYHEGT